MAYGDFKNSPRRAASDKLIRNQAFTYNQGLKNEKYTHLFKIIFGALILQICN